MRQTINKLNGKNAVMNKTLGFSKKKSFIFLLIFTAGFTLSFVCLWYVVNTNLLIEMNKKTNISARSLCVEGATLESGIGQVNNIEAMFPYDGRLSFKEIIFDANKKQQKGEAFIFGCDNNVLNNLLPENSYNITGNQIVIPATFFTDDGQAISTSKLVGSELIIVITEYKFSEHKSVAIAEHQLPVVVSGIYNENAIVVNKNQIFASNILVSEINKLCNGNMYEYNKKPDEMIVIVDKLENVKSVKESLRNLNYECRVMFEFNSGFINMSVFLGLTISILVVIFSAVLFYMLLLKMINMNIKEFGLMKAVGFTNAKICWYVAKAILFIITVSLILAFGITYIVAGITGNAIFPFNFNQSFFNGTVLLNVILIITLCLSVISVALIRIKRISPVVAMREVE